VEEEAKKRRSMEQVRAHLARADSELEAAQRLLHPRTDDEFSPGSLVGRPDLDSLAQSPTPAGLHSISGTRPSAIGATIRRHLFLGVVVGCRIGLDKLISLLTVAHHCSVLRAEWCQEWCQKYANFTSQFVFQASRSLHASHPSANDASG
jgi:hypothetical protein